MGTDPSTGRDELGLGVVRPGRGSAIVGTPGVGLTRGPCVNPGDGNAGGVGGGVPGCGGFPAADSGEDTGVGTCPGMCGMEVTSGGRDAILGTWLGVSNVATTS